MASLCRLGSLSPFARSLVKASLKSPDALQQKDIDWPKDDLNHGAIQLVNYNEAFVLVIRCLCRWRARF
jgi:hypothetical protein